MTGGLGGGWFSNCWFSGRSPVFPPGCCARYVIAGWSLPDTPPGTLAFIYLSALVTISLQAWSRHPSARIAHRLRMMQLGRVFACPLLGLSAYMVHKAVTP